MLDSRQVKKDIEKWIKNFLEIPHPALGNFSPCPYARQARVKEEYGVRAGRNPYTDLRNLSEMGMFGLKVVIYAYDPVEFPREEFAFALARANHDFLLERGLLVLEDHPDDPEIVNGVCMNQGSYALALVQALDDLNEKTQLLYSKGFYDTWPSDYLDRLFEHRKDPRK